MDVVKLLVEELNAALDVTDRWGGTPLDDAEREGHSQVVDYLIARGAPRGYSRRSRHTRASFDDEPDDVDVQVRVTEAWLAALKERAREDFDADAEDDLGRAALPSFREVETRLRRMCISTSTAGSTTSLAPRKDKGMPWRRSGHFAEETLLMERCSLNTSVVQSFFAAVEANYGENPYHNAQHVADVSVPSTCF